MTTTLHKPIKPRTRERRYERGKSRAIIVTLYPAGYMGLRLEGTRREETLPIEVAWERAVKMRIAFEATERLKRTSAVPKSRNARPRTCSRRSSDSVHLEDCCSYSL